MPSYRSSQPDFHAFSDHQGGGTPPDTLPAEYFRHTGISGSSAHEFAEVIICLIVDPSKEFVLFLFHFPSHSTAQRRLSPACGSHCNTYPAISCLIMANPVFFETNLIFSASKKKFTTLCDELHQARKIFYGTISSHSLFLHPTSVPGQSIAHDNYSCRQTHPELPHLQKNAC